MFQLVCFQSAQHQQSLQFKDILIAGLKAIGHFQVKKSNSISGATQNRRTMNYSQWLWQVKGKYLNKTVLPVECSHRQNHEGFWQLEEQQSHTTASPKNLEMDCPNPLKIGL